MGTIIVSVILAAAIVLALIFSRKRGGSCGCGCCDGCANKEKGCGQNQD